MKHGRWVAFLFLVSFVQAVHFPSPNGLFYDGTGVISSKDRAQIESLQSTLRQSNGAQLAVAVIPSLGGLPVEDYAVQLFSKWGVGMKDKNNGVLILVAIHDRQMRIEVGYGLEASLPDGLCGEIIREQMRPAFKAGQYGQGTLDAAKRIAAILQGDEDEEVRLTADDTGPLLLVILLPFFSVFVLVGAFMLGAGLGSKTLFPLFFGLFFGGMPTLLAIGFLHTMHKSGLWLLFFPLLYLLMAVWSFRKTKNSPELQKVMMGRRGTTSGGWSMGGSGGSSGSGSSSGGGGRSGGGGASGSW